MHIPTHSSLTGAVTRRTVMLLTLVAALLLSASLPSSAAPNNRVNEDFLLDVTCVDADGTVLDEWQTVRPNPGQGLPAWESESGLHQVGKSFTVDEHVTVEVLEDDAVVAAAEADFSGGKDHGASAGNKELITCTVTLVEDEVVFEGPIEDAGFASMLSNDVGLDVEVGDVVRITVTAVLTVEAMVPGR